MNMAPEEKIQRAKWLLANIKHASMATVNPDNSPHNTPYFFMANDELTELYWSSSVESQHSQNILRTGDIFTVLYEANTGGGLYIKANNGRLVEGKELRGALNRYNEIRKRHGLTPVELELYQNDLPQKLWTADTQQFWINASEKNQEGVVTNDQRYEIQRSQLL